MTEDWANWENQVVNGIFPLRRFLGRSDHSVVFLTELATRSPPRAAIKLVPDDPQQADTLLSQWRLAAGLSYPHLVRLFETGRCELGGYPFLFVVMEYAEQTLAQIRPHRALTADEARDMLLPTLEALNFLHRRNLVQGQLKPSNFLVVDDQLKLASDTIRPAGASQSRIKQDSLYDPLEEKGGRVSAAGDIWGLGMTIVEALTQSTDAAALPATLPPAFVDIIRRCLSHNSSQRPSASDLEAMIKRTQPLAASTPQPPAAAQPVAPAPSESTPAAAPVSTSVTQPIARPAPERFAPVRKPAGGRPNIPLVAIILIALVLAWAGVRALRHRPAIQPPAANTAPVQEATTPATAPEPAPAALPERAAEHPAQALAGSSPGVLHQELPQVSASARATIRGHLRVTVLVTVDRAGNVIDESLEDPGPSKYFARVASAAAKQWRFAAADAPGSRQWLVRFEFTVDGTTASAALPAPS